MRYLRHQSDATYGIPIILKNGAAPVTGLGAAVTVNLSKNLGAFAAGGGAVTEVSGGLYKYAPVAADFNTLGPLVMKATGAGADATFEQYFVVAWDPVVAPNNWGGTVFQSAAPAISNTSVNQDFVVGSGLRFTATITATGVDSTGWTQLVLTIKSDVDNDSDDEAAIVVRLTNGGSGTDGLLILKGSPAADRTQGAITVGSITPNTTLTWDLSAIAMDLPTTGSRAYRWELDRWIGARKEQLGSGSVTVDRTARRGTAAP